MLKYSFQRKFLFLLILFCAAAGILIAPASADVTGWKLSPEDPIVGDVIKISGEAEPKEIIEVSILHEEIVPVSGTSYVYQINDLKVPTSVHGGKSTFSATASGEDDDVEVDDINVRVKKGRWFTRHADANLGVASISQSNVPSWMNYFVKVDGEVSKDSEGNVTLVFESKYDAAKADKKGNFKFSYDTDSLPAGIYTISIGDISQEFTLSPAKEKGPEEKRR